MATIVTHGNDVQSSAAKGLFIKSSAFSYTRKGLQGLGTSSGRRYAKRDDSANLAMYMI